ncbi:Asp-tRNA(Asn)/Glu-tRNA(Gln) amidotransferase subunit GatC [Paramaledivibacter caminithermalis]|jgi:aspartyl-tRNA(Asn)/glutamyl-tRNA(Gln) amidotransferase subunit C|uniref:Aspartyl/glutamyl-tRNA(Asn/Gln) amidotransferase subunit C n=1 Tax=Paramaledivibacter caminithermalis (strain DSM 15212 / CIP 107654 / DViRD3) TaxID=1121301 RepID=A0A1M6NU01_PARC5|nr:Asp-tRNA(Asn)/Glu-tRNA(Gln) amidotransferase subunit GatC [Paramaledivibacter caminithermalis]SHJ99092.1 aspartyl/glutamyl-tRNA(Asn/Gln) amidotransferase subunit C [Paramaledivibacter caminithermalis DSM 15212]
MSIDIKTIDYIANLARLEFDNKDKEKIVNQLKSILKYMDKLKEVEIDGVEPTLNGIETKNVFRDDVIKPSLDRESILMNASEKKNWCFSVPRVVE